MLLYATYQFIGYYYMLPTSSLDATICYLPAHWMLLYATYQLIGYYYMLPTSSLDITRCYYSAHD